MPARDQAPPGRALGVVLLAGFALCLMAVIPSPAKFHGDERFYTDAALQMTQTGDYWTPHYPDGQIRLLKPILTYWATAVSFRALGIHLLAARLPFLLAGVLMVVLTWRLALTVWRDRRLAFLAALVLASNVELLTLSTRVTPDMLVCLFVLVSMWGFARIWFGDRPSWVDPLLVYGGMGLAVQSKGLLGLCPLAANALFWALACPERARTARLLNVPCIFLGVALGAFWYVAMLERHGLEALQACFADQVGARVARSPSFVFVNFSNYAFAIIRHAFPWTLLLAVGLVWRPRAVVAFWSRHRAACIFLFSLAVVLVIFFTFGNIRRTRYLVSAYPSVAVLLAGVLSSFASEPRCQVWMGRLIRAFAILALLAGGLLALAGLATDWRLAAGGLVLTALGAYGLVALRAADDQVRWTWVAAAGVLVFALVGACIRPVFSPSPLTAVVSALDQVRPDERRVFTLGLASSATGQLRVLAGGRYAVVELGESPTLGVDGLPRPVLATAEHQAELARAGYQLQPIVAANPVIASPWLQRLPGAYAAKVHVKPITTYWLADVPPAPAAVR